MSDQAAPVSRNSEEISLEDLDKILEATDPEFTAGLQSVRSDPELQSADIEPLLDLASVSLTDDEESPKTGWRRKLSVPFVWLGRFLRMRLLHLRNRLALLVANLISFVRNDLPDFLRYLLSLLNQGVRWVQASLASWRSLPWLHKLTSVVVAALVLAAIGLGLWSLKGGKLPGWVQYPVVDLSDKATHLQSTDPKKFTKLYQAFPQPTHTVLMSKFVVNLKRHRPNSNPMGAFEVYALSDSQSTAIELKDRDHEFVDQMARATEDLTYEELASAQGKSRLKDILREQLNQQLNHGRVEEVLIKTMIVKP